MIIVITFILISILVLAIATLLVSNNREEDCISFRETFDLTDIPIVTFYAGENKVNFLLDTGSSQSFIASKSADLVQGKERDGEMSITSVHGTEALTCKVIETVLTHSNKEYGVQLYVNESLNKAFEEVKKSNGANIDGILGSDFLDRYSYVIDFKKYLAYSR